MHTLYRFYNRAGDLLYVGITNNPARRFAKHSDEKSWWRHVARIALEQHPSREALRAAERMAIETERPIHNVRMNGLGSGRASIVWNCDVCGTAIADDEGYVTASYREINAYPDLVVEWERRHPSQVEGWDVRSFTDYMDYPEPASWRVLHRACDPFPTSNDYWISVERIRTLEQVIGWTAHLMESKQWIGNTTWTSVLRRVAA